MVRAPPGRSRHLQRLATTLSLRRPALECGQHLDLILALEVDSQSNPGGLSLGLLEKSPTVSAIADHVVLRGEGCLEPSEATGTLLINPSLLAAGHGSSHHLRLFPLPVPGRLAVEHP